MSDPIWIPIDVALWVHERQIADHGGASGVRDAGLLDSALSRPRNAFVYGEADLCALAALYAEGIVKNHPFMDGNKRTGFVVCELFLEANGALLDAPDEECIALTLSLAAGEANSAAFAEWLRQWVRIG